MSEEHSNGDGLPGSKFTSENKKTSVRFVDGVRPPISTEAADTDQGDDGDDGGDGNAIRGMAVTDAAELPNPAKKKRRKKTRSAAKRGLGKPTGMEEFYADAPMTPEEWQEEQKAYDQDKSFLDRILTAMQRFERTRKLTSERRDVFYKWLHYGGIAISPQTGTGAQNQEDMDKDEIAASLSHILISDEIREDLESVETDEAKYAVDFLGCTQSFLSRIAPVLYAFDTQASVEEVTTTCERFMDYLLQHDVCVEYNDQVLSTRNFCRQASSKVWFSVQAQRWLPGDFNVACSTLFGGSYAVNFGTPGDWDNEAKDGSTVFVGQSEGEAKSILSYGVAGAANDLVYQKYYELSQSQSKEDGLEVIEIQEHAGFEIVAIQQPTDSCKELYKNNSESYRPVGCVFAKPWQDPGGPTEDLTNEEKMERATTKSAKEVEPYVFFIEEIVLQHLVVGQKVIATIRKLNCGIWFFDDLEKVFPEFDVWLLNELAEDWKPSRWLKGAYAPGSPDWEDLTSKEKVVNETLVELTNEAN